MARVVQTSGAGKTSGVRQKKTISFKASRSVKAPVKVSFKAKGTAKTPIARSVQIGLAGYFGIDKVAKSFGMSKVQIAQTAGVNPSAIHKPQRLGSPKNQNRIREMLEVINRVSEWAGGESQAMVWYRAEPIPAFGGRTAESLVKSGQAAAVRDYLDSIAMGGFA